jgi:hypothetical protein
MNGIGEELAAPTNTIAAAAPVPPAHATLAGTGADPLAVPSTAPLAAEAEAEPVGAEPAAATAAPAEEPHTVA